MNKSKMISLGLFGLAILLTVLFTDPNQARLLSGTTLTGTNFGITDRIIQAQIKKNSTERKEARKLLDYKNEMKKKLLAYINNVDFEAEEFVQMKIVVVGGNLSIDECANIKEVDVAYRTTMKMLADLKLDVLFKIN